MRLHFFPLLASEEFDNTAKYSLGRVLLGAQQDSGLKKEEERHIIKGRKGRNWGQECTFNAGIQAQKYHGRERGRSLVIQYPRRGAGDS